MNRTCDAESKSVVIVDTGCANLASVMAAIARLGVPSSVSRDPGAVANARHVVLPGVGAFGPAVGLLRELHLDGPIAERVLNDRPLLAICLGMQLLCDQSEESPIARGLCVVPASVRRFSPGERVPQMGWNAITADAGCAYLRSASMYFANSYRVGDAQQERLRAAGWSLATSQYSGEYVAAMERGSVLACQFHPELSGKAGLELLARWAKGEPGTSVQKGLARRVIPCLDVRDGRVVKGVMFQNLRDAGDPAELAARYEDEGADELTLLDVSATTDGRAAAATTVQRVRAAISIPLSVGGGVRSVDDAARLLDAGADKVGINTAAVERPELIAECADRFGRQCVVVAIDASRTSQGEWTVRTRSGASVTPLNAVAWARRAASLGAGEVLLTSWDRDGTRSGYDLELTRAVASAVTIPVIASGGAAGPEHLLEAIHAGADAVLAASIFHDAQHSVRSVKEFLKSQGVEVRA